MKSVLKSLVNDLREAFGAAGAAALAICIMTLLAIGLFALAKAAIAPSHASDDANVIQRVLDLPGIAD
jgi:hypothetical protein